MTDNPLPEVQMALMLASSVAEVIQELGSAPSGHIYNALAARMSHSQFLACVNLLVRAGLVERKGMTGSTLAWTGGRGSRSHTLKCEVCGDTFSVSHAGKCSADCTVPVCPACLGNSRK